MTTLWGGVPFPAIRDSLLTHSDLLWAHVASSSMGSGFFRKRTAAGGVNWATHLNLVSRPSVSETTFLLTLHALWGGKRQVEPYYLISSHTTI